MIEKLSGKFVELETLEESHRELLRAIAKDESFSAYFPSPFHGNHFDPWFDKALSEKDGAQWSFVVRRKTDDRLVGSTRYYEISTEHRRLMIGYTWYLKEVRGTTVNPECKFLLLNHAFENLDFNRVSFATDFRNAHSRAAIKKLGATEEGILRQHLIYDNGYVRDTVLFSIIKSDWPVVKEKIMQRLT